MTTHIKPQNMAVHCHSPLTTQPKSVSAAHGYAACTLSLPPVRRWGEGRFPCGGQAAGTWAADGGQADALLLVHMGSRRNTVDPCSQPSLQPMVPVLVHAAKQAQHAASRLIYVQRQLEKIDRGRNFAHPKSFKPSSVLLSTGAVTFAGCPH